MIMIARSMIYSWESMLSSLVFLVFAIGGCLLSKSAAQTATGVSVSLLLSSLGTITDMQAAPGDSSRLYLTTRTGEIRIVNDIDTATPTLNGGTFLDISSRVISNNERGLLGLAFHPNFPSNGYFFVNYIYYDPSMASADCGNPDSSGNAKNTRISRFTATSATSADAASELVLAEIAQTRCNHNGGSLQFGQNDGFLYIGLGDGGGGGDPENDAEDLTSYLGKILRVDVDTLNNGATGGVNDPRWTVPSDNPNCQTINSNALGEILGYGVRNPWKFGFDRQTGDLWVADVGQITREEVNYIPSTELLTECHNFGWDPCEGTSLFESLPSGCSSCSDSSCFVVPVLEYGRTSARSITGGYVYRGSQYSTELGGMYLHADFESGTLWGARNSGAGVFSNAIEEVGILGGGPTTFGESADGEIFVATFDGDLFRIVPDSDESNGDGQGESCNFLSYVLSLIVFALTFGLVTLDGFGTCTFL